ncbi:hypothetical protein D3C81_2007270 [compost metagenome]
MISSATAVCSSAALAICAFIALMVPISPAMASRDAPAWLAWALVVSPASLERRMAVTASCVPCCRRSIMPWIS